VLACFRWPSAHEDEAERAVRAGLAISGAQEQAVVGETRNLAARLQAIAEPGGIVISRRTRRLVSGLFELADLGPQRLKASPSQSEPGGSRAREGPKGASRHAMVPG
jgi:hypothetical protein